MLWRLDPSYLVPHISLVYILEKGGRCPSAGMLQPTALLQGLVATGGLGSSSNFQERLLMLLPDLANTPISNKMHQEGIALQESYPSSPFLAFPHKSPFINVPQKHKGRLMPQSSHSPHSGPAQRIRQISLCQPLAKARSDNRRRTALSACTAPDRDLVQAHERTRACAHCPSDPPPGDAGRP